jgi:RNA polymerase sigma-70 factor (ECF subfamily)
VTDEELVLRAREGDTSAFGELVIRHEAAVYRTALAAFLPPEDAQDAAQDTFLRAWSRLGRFRGDASFKTWLLTIAWNRAMTRRRRRIVWWQRITPLTEVRLASGAPAAPDSEIRNRELRTHIRQAIERLTPKLRDALLLAQTGEYDYNEISTMLKIPLGTVKWRVAEARRKVRHQLIQVGCVHEEHRD